MHSGITHDGTPYTKHTHMVMPDEADIGLTTPISTQDGVESALLLAHYNRIMSTAPSVLRKHAVHVSEGCDACSQPSTAVSTSAPRNSPSPAAVQAASYQAAATRWPQDHPLSDRTVATVATEERSTFIKTCGSPLVMDPPGRQRTSTFAAQASHDTLKAAPQQATFHGSPGSLPAPAVSTDVDYFGSMSSSSDNPSVTFLTPTSSNQRSAAIDKAASHQAASQSALPKQLRRQPAPLRDRDIGRQTRAKRHDVPLHKHADHAAHTSQRGTRHAGRAKPARRSGLHSLAPGRDAHVEVPHAMVLNENAQRNRFDGSELCHACGEPYADSNYVGTDPDGISTCGDCWDTAFGVTLVASTQIQADQHHCGCGRDLHAGLWFAVEPSPQQTAYCELCSLRYWGMQRRDIIITIIDDSKEVTRPLR